MKRIRPAMAERLTRGLGSAVLAARAELQMRIPHLICPACGEVVLHSQKVGVWVCTRFRCRYAMKDTGETAYPSHWPESPKELSCGKDHAREA